MPAVYRDDLPLAIVQGSRLRIDKKIEPTYLLCAVAGLRYKDPVYLFRLFKKRVAVTTDD
jgi:YesN/AraC family two-component response regulator